MSALRRVVEFEPAWDRRDPNPSKDYGIRGVSIRFVVAGDDGAAQFLLYSGWNLPSVAKEFRARPCRRSSFDGGRECWCSSEPMPADLGYHRKTPAYAGQESMSDDCPWTGGVCYYDGSGLAADRVYARLTAEGDAGVWAELEAYYADCVATPTEATA